MVNVCFDDIKVELRLHGFDEWNDLSKAILSAMEKIEIKKWFILSFGVQQTEKSTVDVFGVPDGFDKGDFGNIFQDIQLDNAVNDILDALSKTALGMQAGNYIGVRIKSDTTLSKLVSTILHELMHFSQKGDERGERDEKDCYNGRMLMSFIEKESETKAKLLIPARLDRYGYADEASKKYIEVMIANQKDNGWEHEVLPYLIEFKSLLFLDGKSVPEANEKIWDEAYGQLMNNLVNKGKFPKDFKI